MIRGMAIMMMTRTLLTTTFLEIMLMMPTTQEYGDRPPHLIHHDEKDGQSPKKKEPHIKKPLNAFMLYMKVGWITMMMLMVVMVMLKMKLWVIIIFIVMMIRRCGQWFRQSAH